MAIYPRQCFNVAIPNDPFNYPETDFLCRQAGPVIVGSGLCINYPGDIITAGTMTGLCTDTSTGIITIPPGPITTCGTIALANTPVLAGAYCHASFTVDAQGRLTGANSNPPPIPCCAILQKGDLIVGTAPATPTALPVGVPGSVLTACPASPTGVVWANPASLCYCNLNASVCLSTANTTGATYSCALFPGFGTGLYPVQMTANLEIGRGGITRLTGCFCLTSSSVGNSSYTEFSMVGGSGFINRLFNNNMATWIFPPSGSAADYGLSMFIVCNDGPADYTSAYVSTATIVELR